MQTTARIPEVPNSSYFAMNRWFYKMYRAGLLYNVDDPAETIVEIVSGKPVFTAEECEKLNQAVDVMLEKHGDKVYEVGLRYFHKALGITPNYASA